MIFITSMKGKMKVRPGFLMSLNSPKRVTTPSKPCWTMRTDFEIVKMTKRTIMAATTARAKPRFIIPASPKTPFTFGDWHQRRAGRNSKFLVKRERTGVEAPSGVEGRAMNVASFVAAVFNNELPFRSEERRVGKEC